METKLLEATSGNPTSIACAIDFLRSGEVVGLPTETVYGLAGAALNPSAVARIFEAKDRPRFDPLIVHVADFAMLRTIAHADDSLVENLAEKYWPGPLTLLLRKQECVPDLVTSGSALVAVRIPSHPVFQAVLEGFDGPLAAPSANPFGRISPTTAHHVIEGLEGRIPLVLDGGKCQHGLESTIVYPENGTLYILRDGPISREELATFGPVEYQENKAAPGQSASHYAPRKPLILVNSAEDVPTRGGNGFLALQRAPAGFTAIEILSQTGDLVEAATHFFAALHRLDCASVSVIYAERLPLRGLGRAMMDRLNRASAT